MRETIPASAKSRRMQRIVLRVLVVVGGAIAGSAIGWALSSTGASASTMPDVTPIGSYATAVGSPSSALHVLSGKAASAATSAIVRNAASIGDGGDVAAWRLRHALSDNGLQASLASDRKVTERAAANIIGGLSQATGDVARPVDGVVRLVRDPVGSLRQVGSDAAETWQILTKQLQDGGTSPIAVGQLSAGQHQADIPAAQSPTLPSTFGPVLQRIDLHQDMARYSQHRAGSLRSRSPAPRQPFAPPLGTSLPTAQGGTGSGGTPMAATTAAHLPLPVDSGDRALRFETSAVHAAANRQPGVRPD